MACKQRLRVKGKVCKTGSKASNDSDDGQWTVKNVQKAGWDNKSRRNTQESTGKEVQNSGFPLAMSPLANLTKNWLNKICVF